ncbi:MAG: aminofutalosine synthase MqnE [Bacteroidia bacterium]|nr:aminofutalosine synthase MqnE [Bacteroidia bacterium]
MQNILKESSVSEELKHIAHTVLAGKRISPDEGLLFYKKGDLGFLGMLANYIREKKNKSNTYFNKNIHIEPTNICINHCKFCSYSRRQNEAGSWELSCDDILKKITGYKDAGITEVHIVGGVHPDRDLHFYGNLIRQIKKILPHIYVKAFTAVELDYMIKKSGYTIENGLKKLKGYGLDAIPGGGAEIFDEKIRKQICDEKSDSGLWLKIHEKAHQMGIPTNAAMLYGHIENYSHRIDHLDRLRKLQDITGMFQTFIPLKFRNKNNNLSHIKETTLVEDLKNYAVSRIFLDNFPHIKAYWPMIGKEVTQLSLSYGVDDIDGTIEDTTKIYSMAGSEEQKPALACDEIATLIKQVNRKPMERDTLYNVIRAY